MDLEFACVYIYSRVFMYKHNGGGDTHSSPSKGVHVSNNQYPFWKIHLRLQTQLPSHFRGGVTHPPGGLCVSLSCS